MGEAAERVAVQCVKVYGRKTTLEEIKGTAFLEKLVRHRDLRLTSSL